MSGDRQNHRKSPALNHCATLWELLTRRRQRWNPESTINSHPLVLRPSTEQLVATMTPSSSNPPTTPSPSCIKTLGCFHSLQPTPSPFETPRLPCLTPTGFARWQTIPIASLSGRERRFHSKGSAAVECSNAKWWYLSQVHPDRGFPE